MKRNFLCSFNFIFLVIWFIIKVDIIEDVSLRDNVIMRGI